MIYTEWKTKGKTIDMVVCAGLVRTLEVHFGLILVCLHRG
jgi:hypothetical protein